MFIKIKENIRSKSLKRELIFGKESLKTYLAILVSEFLIQVLVNSEGILKPSYELLTISLMMGSCKSDRDCNVLD
jgi:hypothetical protein